MPQARQAGSMKKLKERRPHSRCCCLCSTGPSRTRDLLQQQEQQQPTPQQQQQEQQQLLSALSDDPGDDPFAGAHAPSPSLLGRIAAALPKTLQQHLALLRRSMTHAVHDHTSSGAAHAGAWWST